MEEYEYEHLSGEDINLPLLNTAPRRRTSTSKPLNAIKRMRSVLTSSRKKSQEFKTVGFRHEPPASLDYVPEHPALHPASRPRRTTNVPITNLMAPIPPGQQVPRHYMPRSRTMGNLEDGIPYSRTIGNFLDTPVLQAPNFMRSTSSSAARQHSAIPVPTGGVSGRRPSIDHPNAARSTKSRTQPSRYRQSLPVPSLPTQPENTNIPSHLPLLTKSQTHHHESNSEETPNFTKVLEIPPTPASDSDESWYEKQLEEYRKYLAAPEADLTGEMKSEPELDDQHRVHFQDQRTPTQGNFQRKSEHDAPTGFDFSDQQTPTQQSVDSGFEVAAQTQSRRDDERFRRLPDLGNTMDWSASLSDVQRGKQPAHGKQAVRMAISDVDRPKYEAIAKEQESYESSEGATAIHRGEEDDPRNIYHPMPTSYWSGRFTSASDRFRGEALAAKPRTPDHPMMNDGIRLRRVLNELDSYCKTIEARRSLFAYWKAYASTYGWPRPLELMSFPQIAIAATGRAPTPPPKPQSEQPAEEGSGKKKKKKGGVLGRLGSMTFRRKSGN